MPDIYEETSLDLDLLFYERRRAQVYLSYYDQRVLMWQDHQRRVSEADAVSRGDFNIVFPDETATIEKPKVPNIVQLALDKRSATASFAPLTWQVSKPARSRDKVERKIKAANYYARINKFNQLMPQFFMDYMLAGVSYKLVLPDPESCLPVVRRIDPRFAYPSHLPSVDNPMRDVLVAYKRTRGELEHDYDIDLSPPAKDGGTGSGKRKEQDLLLVLEFYDGDEFLTIAYAASASNVSSTSGIPPKRGILLARMDNKTGKCPVILNKRPSADRQFRGMFDNILGVLNAQNRGLSLNLDALADWIGSPVVSFDIENYSDYGTGRVMHAKSKDAFIRRIPPESPSPAVAQMLAQLGQNAKEGADFPAAQSGMDSHNNFSAAGINALSSPYNSSIAFDQQMEAYSWADTMEQVFRTDEAFFGDMERTIFGTMGQKDALTWKPSRDLKGDYDIDATYGGAAGQDQFNYEIRLTQQVNNGLLSRRSAMSQLSTVGDVLDEERLQRREQLLMAGMQFVQMAASQGNFGPAAALIESLDKNEDDLFQTLASFKDIIQPQQQPAQPQAPQPGLGASLSPTMDQAASASRGGPPGPAGAVTVPGVGALPSLAQLGIGGNSG